jgi:NADPH:quinone reductase-like Zn-dependent oxidoreductase
MKAIVQDRYGSPDRLRLADVETPVPGDHQVLVRVRAAALNARDWHLMRGDPYLMRPGFGMTGPKLRIRGSDFAGEVAAVGPAVTRFVPGDPVYGISDGAFAEYVCAGESVLERKPANLTDAQAAAAPLAGITALIGLRDVAGLQPGQRLLVNGASGGVGTFAVQLGRAYGATVAAVCRTRNVELLRSLRADEVIDYTRDDFTRGDSRYDVVLDLVGNRSLTDLRRVLTPDGTLVLSGGGVSTGGSLFGPLGLMLRGRALDGFVRQRLRLLTVKPGRESLAALRELIESGQVTPVVDRTYPLAEAADAMRYLETEHARAKVVLTC